MPLTRSTVASLQKRLDALLAEFAKDNGLHVTPTQIKFTEDMFEVKTRFSTVDDNPTGVDPRFKMDLIARGPVLGLTPEMIGTTTKVNEVPMEFLGMRASKLIMRDISNNKLYKVDPSFAKLVIDAHTNAKE